MNGRALADKRAFAWADAAWPVWALVIGLTVARAAYLAWFSPFTLTEDEAHYWDWSRTLGWSYYSKGPGTAWAIALSTATLGVSEFAVRLPAVLFSGLGTLAAAGLARDVFGDRRVAVLAALAYQSMPGVQVTGLLMTIDGPFLACWAVACWAGWRAMALGSGRAWVLLGLSVSAGFLFKYTMVMLVVGVLLFAVLRRGHVRRAGAGWVAGGVAAGLLGVVPIGLWNAGHDWATVRHLLGHVGAAGGDVAAAQGGGWHYDPMWTVEYVGLSLAVAGGVFPLAVMAMRNLQRAAARAPGQWAAAGPMYLYCVAAPVAVLYLGVTLVTNVEANWALASFVSLTPVCGWAAVDGFGRGDHGVRFVWNACVAALVALLAAGPVAGVVARYEARPFGLALTRVTGARALAAEAAAVGAGVAEETGMDPFYMATHYGRASVLAFYLPGRPVVYCSSSVMGGRRTQFDEWAHTDLRSAGVTAALMGRPGVLFGGADAVWDGAFDTVREAGPLPFEPKAGRTTWVGLGYRGFGGQDVEP